MKRDVDGILYEALVVALVGFSAALTANHFSPKGLKLTRDYFPSAALVEQGAGGPGFGAPDELSGTNKLAARLQAQKLALADISEVEALFRDPGREAERVIFVDARNQARYEEGHIPGAYLLDHFYPEVTLAEVLPAALGAETVVVYCNGGDCEDSEFAAIFLRDAGVANDRLRVYGGGMAEWRDHGLPVEMGYRGSGTMEMR
jgi:rhodanese-related sulfurtransferase